MGVSDGGYSALKKSLICFQSSRWTDHWRPPLSPPSIATTRAVPTQFGISESSTRMVKVPPSSSTVYVPKYARERLTRLVTRDGGQLFGLQQVATSTTSLGSKTPSLVEDSVADDVLPPTSRSAPRPPVGGRTTQAACGSGSWGGQRLRMADSVRGPTATRETTAAAAC